MCISELSYSHAHVRCEAIPWSNLRLILSLGNKQVDGNLQKIVWYANLHVGRASYANLRIVRISWHVLDSANEKGSFKFSGNKNRAFVCKRWYKCILIQQSYRRAWLNHVYNRLMWPRKRAARSPPLKQACVIRQVWTVERGAGAKIRQVADFKTVSTVL